jgi:hypothetical protein
VGIQALTVDRIEVIATQLRIEGEVRPSTASTTQPVHPASRVAVRRLIAFLLDDESFIGGIRRALLHFRVHEIEEERWMREQMPILRPMADLGLVRMLEVDQPAITNSTATNFIVTNLKGYVAGRGQPRYSRLFEQEFGSPLTRYFYTESMVLTARHMAGISLAVQLYRADMGRWPDSLDALVGKYFEGVSGDPRLVGNQPIGYILLRTAEERDRPMLFSGQSIMTAANVPALPQLGIPSGQQDISLDWFTPPANARN